MISTEIIQLNANSELIVVHLENFDQSFVNQLDEIIVRICEGESDTPCELVKQRMVKFLKTKSDVTRIGAVSEFFIHYYLNKIEFKQDFRFFNLEEGSIKKGFDGVYSYDEEIYVVESKSGYFDTKNISHLTKIKLAYKELKEYLEGKSGKSENNPWMNAYNHASHIDVQTKKTIRNKIKELCDLYDNNKFSLVENFNVIPSSTIYLNNTWDDKWSEGIKSRLEEIESLKAKKIKILAFTNLSINIFYKYIGYFDE